MRDVADLLENIAAGPLHTPALYSTFLKALLASKTEGGEANGAVANGHGHGNGTHEHAGADGLLHGLGASTGFMFDGEMGPVQDISTFPPTMAPPGEDMPGDLLSMDNILSSGFWDSVIVPGESGWDGIGLDGR